MYNDDMPRPKSNPDLDDLPSWIDNPDFVSEEEVTRYKNILGVKSVMARRHPDGWGDEELKAYIVERHHYKIQFLFQERNTRVKEDEENAKRVKEIVRSYLEHFTRPTPNDLVQIEEMAQIQLGLEELNRRLTTIMRNSKDKDGSRDLEVLAKTRKDMLSSFQALEKNLGIDRESRHQESDTVSMFEMVKGQALELMKKRSRSIICPNCEKNGQVFNAGFVVFHFDKNNLNWQFTWHCPRCNQDVSVFPAKRRELEAAHAGDH